MGKDEPKLFIEYDDVKIEMEEDEPPRTDIDDQGREKFRVNVGGVHMMDDDELDDY